jgi:hypothetical protein
VALSLKFLQDHLFTPPLGALNDKGGWEGFEEEKNHSWTEGGSFEKEKSCNSRVENDWAHWGNSLNAFCCQRGRNPKGNDWNPAYQAKSSGAASNETFQKGKEPLITKKAAGPKKRRIITVTEAIQGTSLVASASKTPAIEEAKAVEGALAEVATAEDATLESTLSDIDRVLQDIAAEEAATAAEETMAAVPRKEIAEDTSEEEDFNFQNLVGQELTKAEKEDLREYAISCGYRPGALIFGGVDDEKLGCVRDQTGAKVIDTLSKSIGFPKLETDISRYRRQHLVGSLFYSNFKVKNTFLNLFIVFNDKGVF